MTDTAGLDLNLIEVSSDLFLTTPCSMWDLSSLTQNESLLLAVEAQSLNHWTARKVPRDGF